MVNIQTLHDVRIEEQDLSSGDLTLEADTGESLEILARGVASGADEDVIEESVGEEFLLAYQADDGDDELFPEPVVHNLHRDLLGHLRTMGFNAPSIKVPEGETYVIDNPNDNGNATVLYREGGAQMATGNEPGGPDTKTRTFISNAQVSKSVAASTTEVEQVDASVNPTQLSDFPYEEDVEQGREYDLQGLMVALDNSTSGITLEGFRLVSEEQRWIARDSAFVDATNADYPNDDLTTIPYVFPEQPTFSPGDELTLEVEVTDTSAGSNTAIVNAAMVFYRRGIGPGA